MLAWLLTKVGLGAFTGIAGKIADAYTAKQNATTEQERIQADERIRTLEVIQASQRPVDSWVRAVFAVPVALYYAKLFLWDKVLALGVTDPLSVDMTTTARVIIGFYFLHSLVKG